MSSFLVKRRFWADLGERVVMSFAGVMAAAFTFGTVGVLDVDWGTSLSLAGGAAAFSLFKGLAAGKVGDPGSAALLPSAQGKAARE